MLPLLHGACSANGDFGRLKPELYGDALHDWVGRDVARTAKRPISTDPLTDEEHLLRDLAYPFIEAPYERNQWYAIVSEYGISHAGARSPRNACCVLDLDHKREESLAYITAPQEKERHRDIHAPCPRATPPIASPYGWILPMVPRSMMATRHHSLVTSAASWSVHFPQPLWKPICSCASRSATVQWRTRAV